MLGAKPALRARGFTVNAVKSRQFYEAVSIVRRKKRHGLLRQKIVIHLGTNGVLIQPADCDKIARLAGSSRRVYLVTVTGPTRYPKIRKVQNTRLRACAKRHANQSATGILYVAVVFVLVFVVDALRAGSFTNLILLGSTRMSCSPTPRKPPTPIT